MCYTSCRLWPMVLTSTRARCPHNARWTLTVPNGFPIPRRTSHGRTPHTRAPHNRSEILKITSTIQDSGWSSTKHSRAGRRDESCWGYTSICGVRLGASRKMREPKNGRAIIKHGGTQPCIHTHTHRRTHTHAQSLYFLLFFYTHYI